MSQKFKLQEVLAILKRVHHETYTTPGKTLSYAENLIEDVIRESDVPEIK